MNEDKTPSALCLSLIRAFEQFRPSPYLDAAGHVTIGYGHLVRRDDSFLSITQEEGERILAFDVHEAAAAVRRLVAVTLYPSAFDALVSFAFNLGASSLAKSTLLHALNAGRFEDAAREFRRWHYAGGKPLKGLLRRRIAEELLFLGGHPQSVMDLAADRL